MPITAVCPGSFDPPTEGHLNIIERGLKLFDKIVVAIAVNSQKKTTFTTTERIELLKELLKDMKGVEVDSFEDRLLVDYTRSKKAQVILRGLRTIQDYEYEFQMALANKQIAPEIETVFIMTDQPLSHISSSLTKEILLLGGPGKGLVPPLVEKKLKEKWKKG
jgi:pantetheine-phosphate adenylyltransferase